MAVAGYRQTAGFGIDEPDGNIDGDDIGVLTAAGQLVAMPDLDAEFGGAFGKTSGPTPDTPTGALRYCAVRGIIGRIHRAERSGASRNGMPDFYPCGRIDPARTPRRKRVHGPPRTPPPVRTAVAGHSQGCPTFDAPWRVCFTLSYWKRFHREAVIGGDDP